MMNRSAKIYWKDLFCGWVKETEQGYSFEYDQDYLNSPDTQTISVTLPLSQKLYESATFFPFFDGLIPEGWLLNVAEETWKINYKDRFGLMLKCCKDCIGAVRVEAEIDK